MKLQSFLEKLQYIQSNDFRIIRGQDADPGEYPWQVRVVQRGYNGTHSTFSNKCGGTLISDQWVITADHCVDWWKYRTYEIVLGGYKDPPDYQNISIPISDEIVKRLESPGIFRPPGAGSIVYDIALLKMSSRVNFSPLVFPACVPGPDYKFKNLETVTTTGWGYTRSQPYFWEPSVLQELELKIENRPWCERFIEKRCKDGRMLAITSIY